MPRSDDPVLQLETFIAKAVRREWDEEGSTNAALMQHVSSQ